jgi:hypothetical protein
MTASQKREFTALTKSDGMEVDNLGFLNNQLVELGLVDEPDFDISSDEEETLFNDNDKTELF